MPGIGVNTHPNACRVPPGTRGQVSLRKVTDARPGYEERIGRYSKPLAGAFLEVLELPARARVLDVGCGSGALTERLAEALGPESVAGLDPDPDDLATCASRVPGADLRLGTADDLPWDDGAMDAVVSQLVIGLVPDGPAALREMTRVCRPGGIVAGCVWDFGGGMTMLRAFWDAALELDPAAAPYDQASAQRYTTREELGALWETSDLEHVTTGGLEVTAEYRDTDDLWLPLTALDGGPGRYLATVDTGHQQRVREGLLRNLGEPQGPFRLSARAWYARGVRRAAPAARRE
jgi:SAM-dependent methyltransferase